jgi:hypothetical protein
VGEGVSYMPGTQARACAGFGHLDPCRTLVCGVRQCSGVVRLCSACLPSSQCLCSFIQGLCFRQVSCPLAHAFLCVCVCVCVCVYVCVCVTQLLKVIDAASFTVLRTLRGHTDRV